MKRIIILAALMLLATGFNSCSAQNQKTETMNNKKILVAYFSWSGNTEAAAQYIAQKLGADQFKIENAKPYPADYNDCAEYAKGEKERGERPAITASVKNMEQYDVVIVCAPVWWYTAPMPVFTFLEQYDFAGKTIIPFCTAYSGPSSTLKDIVKATPKSDHRDGICVVTKEMEGKGMDRKHGEIDKWLAKIGF